MDQQIKKLINMQKVTFDNIMDATIAVWNQAEGAMGAFINMAFYVPEDRKRTLLQWVESGRTGLETFKNAADEAYSKVLSETQVGEAQVGGQIPKVKPPKQRQRFEVPGTRGEMESEGGAV